MAKAIFWASFIIIFYTYIGYVSLCVLWGRLFNKKIKKQQMYPFISIIVACYNEEGVIRAKLENLLSLDYPKDKIQILVASESTDKTNEIVYEYIEKGIKLYTYSGRHGKTYLLYKTVPNSEGEILVFSDANVMLKNDALQKIANNFYEENVGAVTGRLLVTNPSVSDISSGEDAYKKYETVLRRANSLLGRVLSPDGALFAIRRKLYNPISPKRGDDFELVIQALINGYDSVFEPAAIAYEDASIASKAEISRKIRMVSWFLRSSVILITDMIRRFRFDLIFQIVSHKLLRWFAPYFFIGVFVSNVFLWRDGAFYQAFLITQICIYTMGICGLYISTVQKNKPPLLLGAMHYFLVFNYAFLIGTIKGVLSAEASSAVWEKSRVQ